jgi:hypothetical protein
MPRVVFETTTSLFEQTKTVHALDRADTVIGCWYQSEYGYLGVFFMAAYQPIITCPVQ